LKALIENGRIEALLGGKNEQFVSEKTKQNFA
jgi:hypothetical protein